MCRCRMSGTCGEISGSKSLYAGGRRVESNGSCAQTEEPKRIESRLLVEERPVAKSTQEHWEMYSIQGKSVALRMRLAAEPWGVIFFW